MLIKHQTEYIITNNPKKAREFMEYEYNGYTKVLRHDGFMLLPFMTEKAEALAMSMGTMKATGFLTGKLIAAERQAVIDSLIADYDKEGANGTLREKTIQACRDVSIDTIADMLIDEGDGRIGICPFHEDSKPSLRGHPSENYFKCFACDKAADGIAVVMKVKGIGFNRALQGYQYHNLIDVSDDYKKDIAKRFKEREEALNGIQGR